jgi:hypothetical protein
MVLKPGQRHEKRASHDEATLTIAVFLRWL